MSYRRLIAALAAGVLCGTAGNAATLVVPNANESVDANSNNSFPFLSNFSFRYQQVFESTQFSALPSGHQLIAITFRPDPVNSNAFSFTISDIEIRLSTTSAAPDGLDAVFANNVGADATLVHSGPLMLSTANVPGPGDTKAFDVVIQLATPFPYDPTQGNLLLDVRKVSNEGSGTIDAATVNSDSVSRSLTLGDADATSATSINTLGLVAQFTSEPVHVPAVGAITRALLAVGLAGLALNARRLGWRFQR